MKKSNLIFGGVYLLLGVIFLSLALFTDTALDGLFFGFTGACFCPGIIIIYKYIYWNFPKNKGRYVEKLENEKIEIHDELKDKLRGKSAQYTYATGLFVISFSTVLFSILDSLKIVENGNIFVYYLACFLLFQILIGSVIYKHLLKKYC